MQKIWYYFAKREFVARYLYRMEKLNIRIEYNEEKGITVKDFISHLSGLENAYCRFTNKKASLSIQQVSKGSVIIDFVQTAVLPTFGEAFGSVSVYDFGNYVIECIKNIRQKDSKELQEQYGKDAEITKCVNTVGDIIGNNNTINQYNVNHFCITPEKNGNAEETYTIDHEQAKEISAKIPQITGKIEVKKKKPVKYESVVLEFDKVSKYDKPRGSYTGFIASIDNNPKKITFGKNIKREFDFDVKPFKIKYLVSVVVHYNEDGTIAKYAIIEHLDTMKNK